MLGGAGSQRYRRVLALTLVFPFGAVFFLNAGFFAEGLTFAFGFAARLGLPATDFEPRGWVSCACAAARRAIGTRNGEHDT